jgi:shikimate-5-dehydrogenase
MAASEPLTQRCAVLGSPVAHSLSPALHTAGYAAAGLTGWSYEAIDVPEADFEAVFGRFGPQWRGLSLTMPLKRVVIPLLAEVSDLARVVGAVNTVTWSGPQRRTRGDNTDVHGIVAALATVGVSRVEGVPCVLGAGATASSSVAALARLGCAKVLLLARSAERAAEALAVAERLGVKARCAPLDPVESAAVVLTAPVVVSTLPAAAAGAWVAGLPVGARPAGRLLDVTYHPWPTALATIWTRAGAPAVGGFEMLLHQAAAQFTLMTGRSAPVEAMRAAGLRALAGF